MVTRVGHAALRVRDLDAASAFVCEVLGLREVEREGGRAYLTCSERHHELVLIASERRGYDHVALEVEDVEAVAGRVEAAGMRMLDGVRDGEPGVDRFARFAAPGGHVFKLYQGMEGGQPVEKAADAPDAPIEFEHVSFKLRAAPRMERFLHDVLGFQLSDRIGKIGSWHRCNEIHHGIALLRTPVNELDHYAFSFADLNALGRIADRVRARGKRPVWGPSRHGPGNNLFLYIHDADGATIECTAEMAHIGPGHGYEPGQWKLRPGNVDLWDARRPTLEFLRSGVKPRPG